MKTAEQWKGTASGEPYDSVRDSPMWKFFK